MLYPKIILIRHGETEWNAEGRYQGQLDSPLTTLGKQQAKVNAQKIKKLFDTSKDIKIISSPLGRTKSTALIISKELGIDYNKIVFDRKVAEFNYGILEGKTKEYCKEHHGKMIETRERDKWFYQIERGESYEFVADRVKEWLDNLNNSGTFIVITHEMVGRALRKIHRDISIDEALTLRQPNSIVLVLENGDEKVLT